MSLIVLVSCAAAYLNGKGRQAISTWQISNSLELLSIKMSDRDSGTGCDGGTGTSSSTEGKSASKRSGYACSFRPDSNTFAWAKVSSRGPSICLLQSLLLCVAYTAMVAQKN